jgi:hypothetical protein
MRDLFERVVRIFKKYSGPENITDRQKVEIMKKIFEGGIDDTSHKYFIDGRGRKIFYNARALDVCPICPPSTPPSTLSVNN